LANKELNTLFLLAFLYFICKIKNHLYRFILGRHFFKKKVNNLEISIM